MASGYIPAGVRSATAASGLSDFQDQNLYAAIVAQHGGGGSQKAFTTAQGMPVPRLSGAAIAAPLQPWQQTHTKLTTIIEKNGELGKGIGDAAIRGLSNHVEQATYTQAGLVSTYGATFQELADLQSKVSIELRVSKKPMFTSPLFAQPTIGGVYGGVSLDAAAAPAVVGVNTLGQPGIIRRLQKHIMCERGDTLELEYEVAANSTLAFRSAASDGIPCLVWAVLPSSIRNDVR